ELSESYPPGQSMAPENLYEEERRILLRKVLKFINDVRADFTVLCDSSWDLEEMDEIRKLARVIFVDEVRDKED
ncbi:MAG: hypothetical protein PWR13_1409, partial [Archaeoglobi archaeon]|nr:hypothetical protein [Archaeoglobi archaeon]